MVHALSEDRPGPIWAAHARARWPAYRRWFLRDGEGARPTYLACERAVRAHMPEIFALWQELCELAGGSDRVARFLSGWRPPPYLTGCSQAVWLDGDAPLLVRNYDYLPRLWEGVLWRTRWDGRAVVGMSDCLWGLLDGINDRGLAVTLAFGGRREVGEGFGIPILLRYVLQTCDTTAEATEALVRVPCHMAYSVTVLDARGDHATVHLSPGREPEVTDARVTTNHQESVAWVQHASATASGARLARLRSALAREHETAERFVQRFLEPPLWTPPSTRPQGGTLYTAVYVPTSRRVRLLWPGVQWEGSIDDFPQGPVVSTPPRHRPSKPS